MISVYTSLYNIQAGLFDWRPALLRFREFASEVVVATTKNNDDSYKELQPFCDKHDIKLVVTDKSLNDYDFDGFLKNAALQECSQDFCILLDADEIIPQSTKRLWLNYCHFLKNSNFDVFAIASVNLCGSEEEYKDIGFKFYLHKNNIGLQRGIVNFAKKENGKIDITKSDTTEIVNSEGNLPRIAYLSKELNQLQSGEIPYVLHYWGVNKEQRIKQSQFWEPVWQNRAGEDVKTTVSADDINNIKVYKHGLKLI
jgi:hypothetical protein